MLPADAFDGLLRKIRFSLALVLLSPQISEDFFAALRTVQDFFKEISQSFSFAGNWRRAAESEAHALFMQVSGSFCEFCQEPLAGFGCESVGDANQVGFLADCCFNKPFDGHRWTEKNCSPAS